MVDVDSLRIPIIIQNANEAVQSITKLQKALSKLNVASSSTSVFSKINKELAKARIQIDAFTNAVTSKYGNVIRSTNNLVNSNNKLSKSYSNVSAKGLRTAVSFVTLVRAVAKSITLSNEYVENLNLFNASMGKFADSALEYANKVQAIMGIDPSDWIRNQGIFMTLATGFGVASDRAYIMSKNLTQLGYDLSSFFNISYEDAFQKLQSGISGELEPLRRLGYDLSQARLEAIALSLGIDKSFKSMTQAEKAQLRYYAIMQQVTTAQGDMARTLEAPANQLRILKAQVTQAARTIGNVFIPMLNAILPVAIVAAKAVHFIASAFASLFGYTLPEIDYSGIQDTIDSVGGLTDELDDATGSAKKLQKTLMGFDEINKFSDVSGGGGGGGGGGSFDFDFELPEYDFIGEAISTRVDELMAKIQPALNWVKDHLDVIWPIVKSIGVGLLSWKIAGNLLPSLSNATGLIKGFQGILSTIAVSVITIWYSFKLDQNLLESGDNVNPGDVIASGLSKYFGAALAGALVSFSTGNKSAGLYTAAASLTISTYLSFKAYYDDIVDDGTFDAGNMIVDLESILSGAFAGALIGFKFGGIKGAFAGAGIGALLTFAAGIIITIKAFEAHKSIQSVVQIFKSAKDVKEYIKDKFNYDIDANVEILTASAELSGQAISDLEKAANGVGNSLNLIRLGVDEENTKKTLIEQITGDKGVISNIQNVLSQDANHLKAIISITPPSEGGEQTELLTNLYAVMTNANTVLNNAVTDLGTTLANLMEESMIRELTASEQQLANSIAMSLYNISNILAEKSAAADFFKATNEIDLDWSGIDFYTGAKNYEEILNAAEEVTGPVLEQYKAIMAEIQAQIWAIEQAQKGVQAKIDYAVEIGDETQIAHYTAELEALNKAYVDFQTNLQNMNPDKYIREFRESLLSGFTQDMEKQISDEYERRYNALLENATKENIKAYKDYYLAIEMLRSIEEEKLGYGLLNLPEDKYAQYEKLVQGMGISLQEAIDAVNGNGLMLKIRDVPSLGEFYNMVEAMEQADGLWPLAGNILKSMKDNEIQEGLQNAGIENANAYIKAFQEAAMYSDMYTEEYGIPITIIPEIMPEDIADMKDVYSQLVSPEALRLLEREASIFSSEAATAIIREASAVGEVVPGTIFQTLANDYMYQQLEQELADLYRIPIEIFREVNGIHSPSTVFIEATSNINTAIIDTLKLLPVQMIKVYSIYKIAGKNLANALLSGSMNKAKELADNISNIPSEHTIHFALSGYSAIISRLNNISSKLKSISSSSAKITIKAGLDSSSRAFLVQLSRVVEGSQLAIELGEMIKFNTYATGGFPKQGEIFIANEAGPELIGRIGNKNAVANEDQIGDVILSYMENAANNSGAKLDEERLAMVLVRALKAAGVGATRIDGRDIARSLNRETQRTGHTPLTIK